MTQTSRIALALLVAFAIFVVSRQELPVYLGILGIGGYDVTSDQCNASGLSAGSPGISASVSTGGISVGIGSSIPAGNRGGGLPSTGPI